jgi:sugar phosphate isomerase/epimerase
MKTLLLFSPFTLHFLAVATLLGAANVAIAADAGTGECFKGPIGLQLYSLRDYFAKDVPGTLDKVSGYGFKFVEVAGVKGVTPEQWKALLAERGLKPIGSHFPYDKFRDDPEGIAREAKAMGLRYAGCAWIGHKPPFDEKQCREAAAVFNRAGEALARHGIKCFYHCHGYEFHPHGDGTLMDLLIKETNPKFVTFELDTLWVVFPGHDPAKLLLKYPGRWELMHLKDLRKGVATGALTGKTDTKNDVALGTGQMDWPAIFRAAKQAGVKYYFIEDESPSAAEQIPQSLKFLEQVQF